METIDIEYFPKVDEHLEAYSLYESKTTLKKVDKIVSILLISIGVMLSSLSIIIHSRTTMYTFGGMAFIIVGVLDFLDFMDFGRIITKFRLKNNEKFKHLQKVKFSNEGIEYETEGINSRIEWSFYKKYFEGENIFILIYGKRQYSVIPKYPFKDSLNTLKKLLEEKIICR
jgi:hypothetical protein